MVQSLAISSLDSRPVEFLVATTSAARDIRGNMGNADYSYSFVLKALVPVLEKLGRWRVVDRPESSLVYQAARAEAEGYRPIQLAIQPPHACYFTPSVPTIVFPFWEFPRIPDRDFNYDTRQNWRRMLGHADLIISACRFTADAFQQALPNSLVEVVPVPLAPEMFRTPAWDPAWTWKVQCRHTHLGGPKPPLSATSHATKRASLPKRAAKRVLLKARDAYKQKVMPWISAEAAERLFRAKNRLLKRVDIEAPLLPKAELNLGGLVYTSVFNLGDRRKNIDDLMSAFILAFRDREDVTLVLKLATNPAREFYEMKELRNRHRLLGLEHRCSIVAITDYLSDEAMAGLMQATTYYLNTSRAEGSCLPLQEAMAAARPAVAPRHTAMEDYIDEDVAFVVPSHPEPTYFPHDPEPRFETSWHRLVWLKLHEQLLASAETACGNRAEYDRRAEAARVRMSEKYSQEAAKLALSQAIARIPSRSGPARLQWAG
jgi:glycosyltransferase involved in cell wall biosynthesis